MKPIIGRFSATRFAVILLSLCLGLHAEARSKTDRVTLDNGDVITGEIKGMENGTLSYSTDRMGTVGIEWDGITTLDSDYFFRIRTVQGARYFGAIGESPIPGYIQVLDADGSRDYPVADIVAIKPIDSMLSDRLDTVLAAGYSDFKASQSSTVNLGLTITYADELSENTLDMRSVVTENEEETNTNDRIDLTRRRLWSNPRYFNYYGTQWERNDELAIDSRFSVAYGIGRHLYDSNRTKLAIIGGAQALTEEDSLGETTESVEGLFIVNYRTWRFTTPELDLVSSLRLYPGITETGRWRADGDITLQWEIIPDFNFNITAFGNFDSESNDEGDDYDYGVTTGVVWEL